MGDDPNELQFDILALLLYRLSSRKEYLPIKDLGRLLAKTNAPKVLCDALTEYLLSTPKDEIKSLDVRAYNLNFEAELHEWTILLDCALVRQIESVRNMTLVILDQTLENGKSIPHLARYLAALLEGFSMPKEDGIMYEWDESADAEVRQRLQRLFSAAQGGMFDGPPDASQVELLQRVASLFTSIDRKRVLKQVISDNRRSSLTAKTVALLNTLTREMDPVESESAELRSWLFMVFDHLTRRFAEDERLSEKTVGFTKQLGKPVSLGEFGEIAY